MGIVNAMPNAFLDVRNDGDEITLSLVDHGEAG